VAQNGPLSVCRPMVAESHDFDEEQDPDRNPHYNENLDLDSLIN
jgi:hypothetical protein